MSFPTTRKSFVILALTLACLGGAAWGVVHYSSSREALATGPQVPDEFSIDKIKAAAKEDPGAAFDRMRALRDRKDLTDEQKDKIRDNGREVMEAAIQERVDEYFKAKPEDRDAILDKHIAEMEKFRKEMEERREKEDAAQAEKDKGKTDEEKQKERDKRRAEWQKRGDNRSQAQRKNDFEKRDANKMAQRMAYFSAVARRAASQGIQMPFGPGRGGPGGGGGGPRGGGGGGRPGGGG